LFGTDFPFAPAEVTAYFTTNLDAYEGFTHDEQMAINHANALTLFPRLGEQDDKSGLERFGNASLGKIGTFCNPCLRAGPQANGCGGWT
jgi:hypothetical protein